MSRVTESIFNGTSVIVPLADVQHIEKWDKHTVPGIKVITKHTQYDREADDWANNIWISEPEATQFRAAWCRYRSELEADTLIDLQTGANIMRMHDETMALLRSPQGSEEANG